MLVINKKILISDKLKRIFSMFLNDKLALISIIFLMFILFIAIFGPYLIEDRKSVV